MKTPGNRAKWITVLLGLGSLLWFLIRVIPKPSRAAYPCQRAAFPFASGFLLWCAGTIGCASVFKGFYCSKKRRGALKHIGPAILMMLVLLTVSIVGDLRSSYAGIQDSAYLVPVHKNQIQVIDSLPVCVSVVKSKQKTAENIQMDEIEVMVREAVLLAGGLEGLISNGMTVVLKPNLVNNKDNRSPEVNGVTTDYRVIQAVAGIVRELNPDGRVVLLEGSANGPTISNMKGLKYLEIGGISSFIALEDSSGGYRDFTSDKLSSINLPDSLSLYPDLIKPNKNRAIYYNRTYFEADVLISIPVLKNHRIAGITGGVKNVAMGCTPANIYGNRDYSNPQHRSQVIDHEGDNLHKWLHDYYAGRPVDFVIMDGLQGVSSGPGGGKLSENQHNMRLILAGKDAIATDAIAGLIMGHDPQLANYLVYLHNHGYGVVDPALIEVRGIQVPDVREDFGFDKDYTTPTKFSKFNCNNYKISGLIRDDILYLKVGQPEDLARMSVRIDNMEPGWIIVSDFQDIKLDLHGVNYNKGILKIVYEDRYLNRLEKLFLPDIGTGMKSFTPGPDLTILPNPVSEKISFIISPTVSQVFQIQILDVRGSVLIREQISPYESLPGDGINVSNLEPGLYYLSIQLFDGSRMAQTFIKR